MGLGLCGWILNDRDRILGVEGQQINHITDPGGWGGGARVKDDGVSLLGSNSFVCSFFPKQCTINLGV